MRKEAINIVWLKRDLHLQDREPPFRAEKSRMTYLPIYLFEPSSVNYPDTCLRHLQFVHHSLLTMNKELIAFERKAHLFYEGASPVFEHLHSQFDTKNLFSFRESGTQTTWQRDKQVQGCEQNHINRQEWQHDGILGGIKNRGGGRDKEPHPSTQ